MQRVSIRNQRTVADEAGAEQQCDKNNRNDNQTARMVDNTETAAAVEVQRNKNGEQGDQGNRAQHPFQVAGRRDQTEHSQCLHIRRSDDPAGRHDRFAGLVSLDNRFDRIASGFLGCEGKLFAVKTIGHDERRDQFTHQGGFLGAEGKPDQSRNAGLFGRQVFLMDGSAHDLLQHTQGFSLN